MSRRPGRSSIPLADDPAHLADRFSGVHLGEPGSSRGSADDQLSAALREFFTIDKADLASKFLGNFPNDHVGKQRKQVFLALFASGEENDGLYAGGELVDGIEQSTDGPEEVRILLQKLSYLVSLKSAIQILDADLPDPLTNEEYNLSSESTATNRKFGEDPIMLRYFTASSNKRFQLARQAFLDAIKKVDAFFYDDPLEKWVKLEADVTYAITILDIKLALTHFILTSKIYSR
jgi:hypothetical protein